MFDQYIISPHLEEPTHAKHVFSKQKLTEKKNAVTKAQHC